MAMPSINPVNYIIERQYKDNIFIKNNLVSARFSKARNLYRKDLLAHYGCVNAIEFSVDGEYLVSGGDDKRVLLWYVPGAIYDRSSPVIMTTPHRSNIFCLTFDSCNEKIFSGGNDDQVLIHQIESRGLTTSIPHDKPVYGISINPQNDNIIATAGEDGRILLFDIREVPNQEVQVVAQENSGFHSVMFNPMKPRYLVTANSEEGIGLWDCRKPKAQVIRYDTQSGKSSGISACFDCTGKKVLALRRRLPPVLYQAENENAICQFYHPQYYNSCTMKTCCFAGNSDEYILSGSDDFNLYMWKIPTDESEWGGSHMILRGHRSIVNQVRYNSHNNFIASSGVEKMIKLWSAVPVGNWRGSILKEHTEPVRKIYTHDDYMSLVGNTDRINHDYSDQSTCEDSKMMAFFDSLIQREIEGWDSQNDGTFSTDSDSDSEEEDWSKLISKIFKNGKCNSEEPKKYRSNRITQLISKKKNTLAKLAHCKSSSYRKKYQKNHKRKSTKSKYGKHNGFHKKSHKKCSDKDCSTPKKLKKSTSNRPSKYFTRSVKNMTDNDSTENSLDTPSTSTGITSSERSIFRLIEQDSDDDARNVNEIEGNEQVEANNFVNILPTPLNGSRDCLINILEVANGNSSSRTLRSSTSASRVSSSTEYPHRQLQLNGGNSLNRSSASPDDADQGFSETSDSDFESTPAKRRHIIRVSDSGCGTGPSSSSSIGSAKTTHRLQPHYCSNDERSPDSERCRKKCRYTMRKAKRVKKKIGIDSDEN